MSTSSKSASSTSSDKAKTLATGSSSSADTKDASSKAAPSTIFTVRNVVMATVVVTGTLALLIVLVFLCHKASEKDGKPRNTTETNSTQVMVQDKLSKGAKEDEQPRGVIKANRHDKDKPSKGARKAGHHKSPTNKNLKVCQTEACAAAGKGLFEAINFTADPCDDFHEYACGNWIAQNPIPKDKVSVGSFEELGKKKMDMYKELLDLKPNKSKGPVAKSVQLARDLYRECLDTETRDKLGHQPLKKLVGELLGTSWPILDEKFKSQQSFVKTIASLKQVVISTIVSFHNGYDPNSTYARIITFVAPNFFLNRHEFVNRTKYANKIAALGKLMLRYGKLFAGNGVDEKLLQKRFDEVFEFESKLALFTRPNEQSRDAKVWYNKMSFADFKKITANRFDGLAYPRKLTKLFNLSHSFKDTDLVIVKDIPYYQKLPQLLDETPDHVLYNYIGFRLVQKFSPFGDSKLNEIDLEYSIANGGINVTTTQWKKCISRLYQDIKWAIGQLYVDRFVAPGTKERAEELIADMRAAFNEIVQTEAKWLDETTRTKALEKAAATHYYVAYPEWIHDNAVLDELHGFTEKHNVQVKKGQYFKALAELEKFNVLKSFREFHKPRNVTLEWIMPPQAGNAAIRMSANTAVLPAGILHPPFFHPGRPAYLNYGAIGVIIGHEITHHFDDQGSQYDKDGNLVNWWTPETKEHFKKGAQCFADQFGSIIDKVTGLKLNGIITLGENIGDNGGIREAFFAFKSLAKKSPQPLVPQMEAFTTEQLFFLSYGKVWCSNKRKHILVNIIENGPHPPPKYRVNVPLSNFDKFAKAFNCPTGSKMNPTKKCQLW